MNNREKIIIFITMAVALYGIFDYLIFPSPIKDRKGIVQSETKKNSEIFTQIDENLTSLQILIEKTEEVGHLISLIESEWENDPFINLEKSIENDFESITAPDAIELTYSGFIQFDTKILAVINGMEYMTGEYINDTKYQIASITSSAVILNFDKNKQTTLFLKEE